MVKETKWHKHRESQINILLYRILHQTIICKRYIDDFNSRCKVLNQNLKEK